jgi:hypothetical protein
VISVDLATRIVSLIVGIAVLVGLGACGGGDSDAGPTRVPSSGGGSLAESPESPADDGKLEPCPSSSWADGGGTDYAVEGIECSAANDLLVDREFAPGNDTQFGRGLTFGDWICIQHAGKGESGRATETTCANGESRFRFLFE